MADVKQSEAGKPTFDENSSDLPYHNKRTEAIAKQREAELAQKNADGKAK